MTMTSSKIPLGITLVLFANSKMVGVGRRRDCNCNCSKVVAVITLMVAPRYMRVFPIETSLMLMVTTGFLDSHIFLVLASLICIQKVLLSSVL
jgi:hypothetical protein